MPKTKRLPDWTARIIIRTPEGVLMVRIKNEPWHLPGGKREPEDRTSLATAKRELEEETGLPKNRGDFRHLMTRYNRDGSKGKYDVYYFEALYEPCVIEKKLESWGAHGEETRIIPYEELRTGKGIDSRHHAMLEKLGCLAPRRRY